MKGLIFFSCMLLCFVGSAQIIDGIAIVRVSYPYLDFEVIDDKNVVDLKFIDIMNNDGSNELERLEKSYPGIKNFPVSKIFKNLTTRDTLSISRLGQKIPVPPFWATFTVQVPKQYELINFIRFLNNQTKFIDYAHPDYIVQLQSTPNDSLYPKQRSLNDTILTNAHINIQDAWNIETGEPWIKIGIHDSGIDSLHPDTGPALLFGGTYNHGNPDPFAPTPSNWGTGIGHGHIVASIVGAKRNNTTGIAGIAGGNDSTELGVSLIDFYSTYTPIISTSYFMAGVVDGARSVGSYWDYPDNNYTAESYEYFNNTPGFGIHIGNHSYVINTELPQQQINGESKIPAPDSTGVFTVSCDMCREAFLFSLRNGVINVVARGNSGILNFQEGETVTQIDDFYPQAFPDGWIISVGASGYDGVTVQEGLNQSVTEANTEFYSLYGGNMDLIAPGSDSIVLTTYGTSSLYPEGFYTYIRGTSVAAPHVTGVVGLLLSYYNEPNCYSNRNLSIEDVEYILQNSASQAPGYSAYNDTTGWGRLDALAALKMIELPTKQIIHPDSLISSIEIQRDTIALGYGQAFVPYNWGPISSGFPLASDGRYETVRVLIENTYSIAEYIQPSTTILDYWARPSASNSVQYYEDTVQVMASQQLVDTTLLFDLFDSTPYAEIDTIDLVNNIVKIRGYYYHFIGKYLTLPDSEGPDTLIVDPVNPVDVWYPINPIGDTAIIEFSIYIQDDSLLSIYDYPCDSTNLLYDSEWEWPFDTSGLDEITNDHILVYPNPFNESINISFMELEGTKEIYLLDINGRKLFHDSTINNSYILNSGSLSRGIYFITCVIDEIKYTAKIVKE